MIAASPRFSDPDESGDRVGWSDAALALLAGGGFTLLLFCILAFMTDRAAPAAPVEVAELRQYVLPPEPPPPRPTAQPTVPAEGTPISGIAIEASTSPVKVAVVPPDLLALVPATDVRPSADIQVARFDLGVKAEIDVGMGDPAHIYQVYQVDRRPTVLFRTDPRIPAAVRKRAQQLRVILLLVVDTRGEVTSVRALDSSGNPEFDQIVADDVAEHWRFSPAMKNGRAVRCLVQQAITVRWGSAGPFEL